MATAQRPPVDYQAQALNFIQQAIEADHAQAWVKALNLYKKGCSHFLHVMKYNKNAQQVCMVRGTGQAKALARERGPARARHAGRAPMGYRFEAVCGFLLALVR